MSVVVGVELKQHRSALCVVDSEHREGRVHFFVRHLERLPVRMPFPQVGDRLVEIMLKTRRKGNQVRVYVNETDVAAPVVDLLQRSVSSSHLRDLGFGGSLLQRCTFFQGKQEPALTGRTWTLGKAWIVSRLVALLQSHQLHFPETREARVLSGELLTFDGAPAGTVPDAPGSFRVGTQDDLINALGLAVHTDPPRPRTPEEQAEMNTAIERLIGVDEVEAVYGPLLGRYGDGDFL
jgi:hypothetical protein